MTDTVFASATAPGRAAVAVIRLSGPGARTIVQRLAGSVPKPRVATPRRLRDARGQTMDRALVLWFPGPGSYTGEDCAEFHLHGGVAIVDLVIDALLALGARLAGPGEFTRRAFENGKFALDQAEAIGDLVDAETRAQARQAVGQLGGALGRRYGAWRDLLIEALALLEAGVDFPDEETPPEVALAAHGSLTRLTGDIDLALRDQARGQRVREGYRVAIVGAPNAGKSSLLNALAGRPAAIVTEIAGTTRDVIEVPLVLEGYKIILADTAGIRTSADPIEAEGVRRARAWADAADLRLWIVDGSASDGSWRQAAGVARDRDLCLINKTDLPQGKDSRDAREHARAIAAEMVELSLLETRAPMVREALGRRTTEDLSGSDFPAATRARHAELLRDARDHLGRALETLADPELAAEDVRLAARALAQVTGKVGVEDVLDRVFATFCIGK